jgi:hypothetical protein
MNTIVKNTACATLLVLMMVVDIPLLPVELVPDAEAIFGVRRRTAVIAYSAGAASGAAAASAKQQQTAPPPQQAPPPQPAAAPQQQASPPQPVSAVPVGTVVETLPGKCVAVTVANVSYQDCEGTFYRAAFKANNLVYVSVEKPL